MLLNSLHTKRKFIHESVPIDYPSFFLKSFNGSLIFYTSPQDFSGVLAPYVFLKSCLSLPYTNRFHFILWVNKLSWLHGYNLCFPVCFFLSYMMMVTARINMELAEIQLDAM